MQQRVDGLNMEGGQRGRGRGGLAGGEDEARLARERDQPDRALVADRPRVREERRDALRSGRVRRRAAAPDGLEVARSRAPDRRALRAEAEARRDAQRGEQRGGGGSPRHSSGATIAVWSSRVVPLKQFGRKISIVDLTNPPTNQPTDPQG